MLKVYSPCLPNGKEIMDGVELISSGPGNSRSKRQYMLDYRRGQVSEVWFDTWIVELGLVVHHCCNPAIADDRVMVQDTVRTSGELDWGWFAFNL
ncbi:hypothetical protein PVK06_046748 [Gossypium arboreum]|uniref:Uncharacterized protein n=1 Tax=Gossypium arboreum TaxID=29729 RepID=A0ABR0MDD8_GOSAR|nr:hypothetical protein PVK06_046748 [Gossypium arboreum]